MSRAAALAAVAVAACSARGPAPGVPVADSSSGSFLGVPGLSERFVIDGADLRGHLEVLRGDDVVCELPDGVHPMLVSRAPVRFDVLTTAVVFDPDREVRDLCTRYQIESGGSCEQLANAPCKRCRPEMTVTRVRGTGRLHGVVSRDGAPAQVHVEVDAFDEAQLVTTDASGAFDVETGPGHVTIQLRADWSLGSTELVLGEAEDVSVDLHADGCTCCDFDGS